MYFQKHLAVRALMIVLLLTSGFVYSCKKKNKTVTDVDGNVYHVVKIGKQRWLKENLKTTHYRNGDPIAHVTDGVEWYNSTNGAYCSYNNDAANSEIYGHLYNWYAVDDSRGLAPEGYHIATKEDWEELIEHLDYEGGDLKETGTAHWLSPNAGATNKSGFTALPAGMRAPGFQGGGFTNIGSVLYVWTSHEGTTQAYRFTIDNIVSGAGAGYVNKNSGYSVRCVKN